MGRNMWAMRRRRELDILDIPEEMERSDVEEVVEDVIDLEGNEVIDEEEEGGDAAAKAGGVRWYVVVAGMGGMAMKRARGSMSMGIDGSSSKSSRYPELRKAECWRPPFDSAKSLMDP